MSGIDVVLVPDPSLLVGLAGVTVLYARGRRRLPAPAVARVQPYRFAGALAVLVVALGPEMERLAASSLTTHMVQHQLLTLVAAPLLASAGVGPTIAAAVGRSRARPAMTSGAVLGTAALGAALLHLAVLLGWHYPPAYRAALTTPVVHQLEHLTMLGTAFAAWAVLLRAGEDDRAVVGGVGGFALLAIGGAGLGVVLLASPDVLYGAYGSGPLVLADQQAAGATMKVGSLLVYTGAAALFTARWFHRLAADDDAPRAAPVPPAAPGGRAPAARADGLRRRAHP